MTVKKLIELLQKQPQDYEVVFYKQGSVYDTKVKKVKNDKGTKYTRKQVILTD